MTKLRTTLTLAALAATVSLSPLGSFGKVMAAESYNPQINPADFSTTINNKYLTLKPGKTYFYAKQTKDGLETEQKVVTNLTREVMGVKTLVVWDRFWLDGKLIEEAYDWNAQDKSGNVWYFGEESREYENGVAKSTHGSWEAGINGAKPGIVMKSNPKVGDSYYQEYAQGIAEDRADIVAIGESVKTPYADFSGCLKTSEYTALEPSVHEFKYACPAGQGVVATRYADDPNAKEDLTAIKDGVDFVKLGQVSAASSKTDDEAESEGNLVVKAVVIAASLGAGIVLGLIISRSQANSGGKSGTTSDTTPADLS